jgi:hypothetical protein
LSFPSYTSGAGKDVNPIKWKKRHLSFSNNWETQVHMHWSSVDISSTRDVLADLEFSRSKEDPASGRSIPCQSPAYVSSSTAHRAGFCSGKSSRIASLADEDWNSNDRDDGIVDGILLVRNPELVFGDDQALHVRHHWPLGGCQLSWRIRLYSGEGSLMTGEREGEP